MANLIETNDPVERVAVLSSDLEQWAAALRWAHGLAAALDLQEGYLSTRPAAKTSKLTNVLAQSHNRIQGYLDDGFSDDESLPSD